VTVEHWLAHRSPPPPGALAARIGELLDARGHPEPGSPTEPLVDAAERVLARLLREGCATRQSALDLLAADAMATYAFEAAADEPERMTERTDRAMLRIAALAETLVGSEPAHGARDACR
jgi:hypothetical protein